jgi:hypothetical protein
MFQRGRKAWGLFIIACGVALSGCGSNAGWQYQPGPAQLSPTRVPLSVGVLKFQDQRETENTTYSWLCIIPLIPYCTDYYHRPETASEYNFRPDEDLANATAVELRQTGLFRDVFVTDRATDPGAQLLLRGTIISTDWNATRYAYLLGLNSDLFYIFGLPIDPVKETLKLKLELIDPVTSQVLWTGTVDQDYAKTEGLYYNYGEDFGYPAMFREGIKPALGSLESYVVSQPPNVWQHYQKTGSRRAKVASNQPLARSLGTALG